MYDETELFERQMKSDRAEDMDILETNRRLLQIALGKVIAECMIQMPAPVPGRDMHQPVSDNFEMKDFTQHAINEMWVIETLMEEVALMLGSRKPETSDPHAGNKH